jgi:hypothetical protein
MTAKKWAAMLLDGRELNKREREREREREPSWPTILSAVLSVKFSGLSKY